MKKTIIILILLSLPVTLQAEIINVPDDYETIQEAVNEAAENDTVLVQPGEYNERVGFPARNIVLGSLRLTTGDERYIERTVIDAVNINRSAVRIGDGQNESTVFDGFTVRNGNTDYGGGIYVSISRPTLRHLIIESNNATGGGGGIYLTRNSVVTVSNSVIRGNTGNIGGGIVVINGSGITLRDCNISENETNEHGGGIHVTSESSAFLEDVIIEDNVATMYGGGVHCNSSSDVTLRRVQVLNNTGLPGGGIAVRAEAELRMELVDVIGNITESEGGGLHATEGYLTADSCTFTGNFSQSRGGAMFFYAGDAEFNRCVVYQNENDAEGTIYVHNAPVRFVNCTIADNVSEVRGEIYLSNGGNVDLVNTIIRNELLPVISTYTESDDTLSVRYCDISGGPDSLSLSEGDIVDWGEGNIDADPLFADPDEADYHLTEDSPCIDAGDPETERDPDHSRSDIGAHYFHRNQPPYATGTIPHVIVDEDSGFLVIADLDTLFADLEEDTITYDIEPNENLGLAIVDEHILTIEPVMDFCGDSIECGVFAIDEQPGEVLHFLVTVTGINDSPSAFSLITPENNTSLPFLLDIESVAFGWQRSVDPDPADTLEYVLWLHWENSDDSCSFPTADTIMSLSNQVLIDSLNVEGWEVIRLTWWVTANSGEEVVQSNQRFTLEFGFGDVIEDNEKIPAEFALNSIYPNPFNSSATIMYSLPNASQVSMEVFDLVGRNVKKLVNEYSEAGRYKVSLSGDDMTSGVYLVRMTAGGREITGKFLLIR